MGALPERRALFFLPVAVLTVPDRPRGRWAGQGELAAGEAEAHGRGASIPGQPHEVP